MQLPDVRADLNSEHEEVRLQAVLALSRSGDPAVIPLLSERATQDPSPVVRYHARKALESMQARASATRPAAGKPAPDPAASSEHHLVMAKVEQALLSAPADQKGRLLEALAASRDRRYLPMLDKVALADRSAALRRAAARARDLLDAETLPPLPQFPDAAIATTRLQACLSSANPLVRAAGIRRAPPEWKSALTSLAPRSLLAEEDPWVTIAWLLAIAAIHDPALGSLVSELLRRRDPHVRARAAVTWLALEPEAAMPFVTPLLDDSDELARQAVLRALEERDTAYLVQLLESRVTPAKIAAALRSLQFLGELDSPLARRAEVRILGRESDGRIVQAVQAAIGERLPATELPQLLELAAKDAARKDRVLEAARAIQTRDKISEELFTTLLQEYNLAPREAGEGPRGRRRVRKLRKTVQILAQSIGRGTRAVALHVNRRNTALAAVAAVLVGLGAQTGLVWYPAYRTRKHTDTALQLYLDGDRAGASRELERALAYDPDNRRAMERVADVAFDDGDVNGARDAMALVKVAGAGSAEYRRLTGRLRLAEGDAAGAVRILEDVATSPDPLARVNLAAALIAIGKPDRAAAELETLVKEWPRLFAAQLELARALAASARPKEAAERVNRILAEHPQHPDARKLQGALSLAARDWNKAEKAYRVVLETRPRDTEALLGLGRAQEGLLLPTEARRTYQQVLDREPEHADAMMALARIAISQREYGQARETYVKILTRRPADFRATFALGLLELQHGDASAALARFQQANEMQPRSAEVLYNAGLAQLKLKRPREAAELFRASLKMKPNQSRAWLALGYLAQQEDQQHDALRYYEKALELDPASLEALVNLGVVLMALGRNGDAEKSLRRALQVSPGQPAALKNLALLGKGAKEGP